MALCVYHETTEAVATCVSCKQDICAKCREYGEDGLCGMCLEMQNARKASMEASRQAAAVRVTAVTMDAERPGPSKAAPRPAPKTPTKKPPAKPGMCVEHPDKAASATCTHCQKKFCPFCLDLYDLCAECRTLPHCSRHESLVAAERCAACKLPYCKACLGGGDRCDRCRTLGLTGGEGAARATRSPTQPLKQQTRGTGKLAPPPAEAASAEDKPRPTPPKRPTRPPNKRSAGAYKPPSQRKPPWLAIVAVIGVLGLGFHFLNKPSLSPAEQLQDLQTEMQDVQQAVEAVHTKQGSYPTDETAIMTELAADGVNVQKLPLPLKLFVNAPANEPLSISYYLVRDGYEIRALDAAGAPLQSDGRDVVLSSTSAAKGASKP